MEAIILAGGKAERLGDAAGGRPKSLVDVAGRPLVSYQVTRLVSAGVERVIVSCAAAQGSLFERELAGLGAEIVVAEEPERLGRGGGIKFAARERNETGDVYALNGDELVDVDFEALLDVTARRAVRRPSQSRSRSRRSASSTSGRATWWKGSARAGKIPYWVNCGIYVLSAEAVERLPEVGDHETTIVSGARPRAGDSTRTGTRACG